MSDAAEERARLERLVAEMRGTLGEEHLATLSAMLDLADCLWAEGRLIAARKLEEQVVAGRRHRLGEQHFDTLKAIGKLAVTMAAQGDLTTARELQEYVVEGIKTNIPLHKKLLQFEPFVQGRYDTRTIERLLAEQGPIAGAAAV